MAIDPRVITPLGSPAGVASQMADLRRRLAQMEATRSTVGDGTITGGLAGHIAATTIDATNIQAGSITAGLIAAGAINAGHISAGAINAGHIAAGTITAGHIATDTITANEIAAGAITTSELAADSVTSAKIQAGTIIASDIQSGTITAAQIAATTITAAQIAAGTITSTQIAATTITGANIAGGTITATNIQAGTIVNSLIATGTLTGDRLVAGTITATQIGVSSLSAISANMGTITAGTITGATFQTSVSNPRVIMDSTGIRAQDSDGVITFKADAATGKIITLAGLGGGNMVPNSSFEDVTQAWRTWAVGNASVAVDPSFRHGAGQAVRLTCTTAAQVSIVTANTVADRIPVNEGQEYTLTGWIRSSGISRPAAVRIEWYDASSVNLSNSIGPSPNTTAGVWERRSVTATAPAGAVSCRVRMFCSVSGFVVGDVFTVDDMQLEEGALPTAWAPKPDEVLPQTIEGGAGLDHIKPATIVGGDLVANTITATQIQAATITSVQIASATITAGNIATGTITAAQIAAGTITADRMSVSALSAITANLGTVTAGTITGATMQTAISGSRVVLDTNGLRAFETTNETFRLASSDGSLTILSGAGSVQAAPQTLSNPSFATNTTGWTASSISLTRNTTTFQSSPAAGALSSKSPDPAVGVCYTDLGGTFLAGNTYILTFYTRLPVGGTLVNWFARFGNLNTSSTDYGSVGLVLQLEGASWQKYQVQWTPAVDFASARFQISVTTLGAGATFLFDTLSLQQVVVPVSRQVRFLDSIPSGEVVGQMFSYQSDTTEKNASLKLEAYPAATALTATSEAVFGLRTTTGPIGLQAVSNAGVAQTGSGAPVSGDGVVAQVGYERKLILNSEGQSDFVRKNGHGGAQDLVAATHTAGELAVNNDNSYMAMNNTITIITGSQTESWVINGVLLVRGNSANDMFMRARIIHVGGAEVAVGFAQRIYWGSSGLAGYTSIPLQGIFGLSANTTYTFRLEVQSGNAFGGFAFAGGATHNNMVARRYR